MKSGFFLSWRRICCCCWERLPALVWFLYCAVALQRSQANFLMHYSTSFEAGGGFHWDFLYSLGLYLSSLAPRSSLLLAMKYQQQTLSVKWVIVVSICLLASGVWCKNWDQARGDAWPFLEHFLSVLDPDMPCLLVTVLAHNRWGVAHFSKLVWMGWQETRLLLTSFSCVHKLSFWIPSKIAPLFPTGEFFYPLRLLAALLAPSGFVLLCWWFGFLFALNFGLCCCCFVIFVFGLVFAVFVFFVDFGCCLEDLALDCFEGFPLPLPHLEGWGAWAGLLPKEFFAILASKDCNLERRRGFIFLSTALLIRSVVWGDVPFPFPLLSQCPCLLHLALDRCWGSWGWPQVSSFALWSALSQVDCGFKEDFDELLCQKLFIDVYSSHWFSHWPFLHLGWHRNRVQQWLESFQQKVSRRNYLHGYAWTCACKLTPLSHIY